MTVIGWGSVRHSDEGGISTPQPSCSLQETNLTVVNNKECEEITNGDNQTKICAFGEDTDSCQGDSGIKGYPQKS